MSNDKSTVDDITLDLDDSPTNDSSADEAERSDDSLEETESDDEVGTELDLDPEKEQEAKREAAALQHAKSWAAKIVSGKADYEDIPANHRYLIPKVKALLGQKEEVTEKERPTSANHSVKVLVKYETLKDKVQNASRTKQQTQLLKSEFDLLISKGFDPHEALKRAIKEAEIDLSEPAVMPKVKLGGSPSTSEKKKYTGLEDTNKMNREELANFLNNRPR